MVAGSLKLCASFSCTSWLSRFVIGCSRTNCEWQQLRGRRVAMVASFSSCVDKGLGKSETSGLMEYLKGVLAGKCWGVKSTPRLVAHPCVVTVEEMASARHFVRTQFSQIPEHTRYSLLQPTLEINPSHPVIVKLNKLRTSNPDLAALVAKQLFSNALVVAGLVDDPRTVVTNMNELLEKALDKH